MSTHQPNIGRVNFNSHLTFNGVRVFSATMMNDRDHLGEKVTAWIEHNPSFKITDVVVTQPSTEAFPCTAITVFYFEDLHL